MKNLIKTEEEIMKGEEEHSSDDLERKSSEDEIRIKITSPPSAKEE